MSFYFSKPQGFFVCFGFFNLQNGGRINSYFRRLIKGLLDLNPEHFEIITKQKQNGKMELFFIAHRSSEKCLAGAH